MYAIIQAAGHQYRVEPGQIVDVDRLPEDTGNEITFDQVLLVGRDDGSVVTGSPVVHGAQVTGVIDSHARGPKVRVFRHKRRKGMRRTQGHRTDLTRVRITNIADSD
ncbi:MAG: 50S ribosomal protein L21 [Acidobacteriota bacterium]|nr:50S ribosomal protein L21 [Acidobacteriota bacterium]